MVTREVLGAGEASNREAKVAARNFSAMVAACGKSISEVEMGATIATENGDYAGRSRGLNSGEADRY